MPLSLEDVRRLTYSILESESQAGFLRHNLQLNSLLTRVVDRAEKEHIDFNIGEMGFEEKTEHRIRVVLAELENTGLIVFGYRGGPNLPWFELTEYGIECFRQGRIDPYDPDRYLVRLRAGVPNLDLTALRYVQESLECLRRNCFMACAVMLGGAAEQVFIVLTEALHKAMKDPKRKQDFETNVLEQWQLKQKFDYFRKNEMDKVVKHPAFPEALKDDLGIQLLGIFSLIRRNRNDAGHPSIGATITREIAHANLLQFPSYCKTAYELIGFFNSNANQL